MANGVTTVEQTRRRALHRLLRRTPFRAHTLAERQSKWGFAGTAHATCHKTRRRMQGPGRRWQTRKGGARTAYATRPRGPLNPTA